MPVSATMAIHSDDSPAMAIARNAAFTPSASAMFIAHGADRRAAEPNRERQARQFVAHQRHVSGLERRVAADGAHRDADIRRRQGGRVVHAVADHAHLSPRSRRPRTASTFSSRQETRAHVLDADRLGQRPRGAGVIAGQHRRVQDARSPQELDHVAGRFAGRVCQHNRGQ